jgi:hypothetical protein
MDICMMLSSEGGSRFKVQGVRSTRYGAFHLANVDFGAAENFTPAKTSPATYCVEFDSPEIHRIRSPDKSSIAKHVTHDSASTN